MTTPAEEWRELLVAEVGRKNGIIREALEVLTTGTIVSNEAVKKACVVLDVELRETVSGDKIIIRAAVEAPAEQVE